MRVTKQIAATFQSCIEHGHWMEDAPPSTPSSVDFGFVLRCARGCGTFRHLEVHPATGQVTHSHYTQPPEYKEFKAGRTRGEVRLEDLESRKKKRRLRAAS